MQSEKINNIESLKFMARELASSLRTLLVWTKCNFQTGELKTEIEYLKKHCIKVSQELSEKIEKDFSPVKIIDHGPITKEQGEKISQEHINQILDRR